MTDDTPMSETRLFAGEQKCLHRYSVTMLGCELPYGHAGAHEYPGENVPLCHDRLVNETGDDYHCNKRKDHVGLHGQKRREGGGFDATWATEPKEEPMSETLTNKTLSEPYLLEFFAKLPLPVRMRAAAEVLEEANRKIGTDLNNEWQPSVLEHDADVWEREDAKKAERERIVEELAAEVFAFWSPGFDTKGLAGSQETYRERIRAMLEKHPHIAEGWTRETDDV